MTYGSILVPIDDHPSAAGSLEAARRLAADFGAHLEGLAIIPPLAVPLRLRPRQSAATLMKKEWERDKQEARAGIKRFEAQARKAGVASVQGLAIEAEAAAVIALRWLPPPTTAFVLARRIDGWTGAAANLPIRRDWVAQSQIAPEMFLAVVAAEDQRFPEHFGFDLQAIEQALDDRERGRVRGASTISQQVAKNLFLWSGRSWVRKGLEVWFTGLIELCWPKRRILEVYVNVAEFGDGVYGVQAASRQYFGRDAAQLNGAQAARLAAVLPSPKRYNAARPGPYVLQRQQWIERQMRQLGGRDYLAPLLAD